MAFVREIIVDGNKELYDSFNLIYNGKNREANEFTTWYADKEREIYFVFLGGGVFEQASTYALIWKNKKIIIDVNIRPTENTVYWLVEKIIAPENLRNQSKNIIKIFGEAVRAMYTERNVEIKNTSNIFFVKECVE